MDLEEELLKHELNLSYDYRKVRNALKEHLIKHGFHEEAALISPVMYKVDKERVLKCLKSLMDNSVGTAVKLTSET